MASSSSGSSKTRFLDNRPVNVNVQVQNSSSGPRCRRPSSSKSLSSSSLFGEDTLLNMVHQDEEQGQEDKSHEQSRAQMPCKTKQKWLENESNGGFIPASQVRVSSETKQGQNKEILLLESSDRCDEQVPERASSIIKRRRGSNKVIVTSYHENSTMAEDRTLDSQERLEMRYWGLPELVLMRYAQKGITTMFPWQAECLGIGEVLEGGNLVYSAPTSAGKTLVAEMLMVKRVVETKKKAIIILPFVSLAREKMFGLQGLLQDLPVRVHGFMGSQAPAGGLKRADIAVCTIEKANSLINRLLESKDEDGLESIGCIVVDELHLLGDHSRGYLLELLLTKVRYMSWKNASCNVQIIGMSATLPNLELLANWLDADLYKTDFRPVPLSENVKIGRRIYDSNFQFIREIHPPFAVEGDSDNLVYLCLETVLASHSVLVFCPTKNWCEKLAETVAKEFFNLGRGRAVHVNNPLAIEDIREQIQKQLSGQQLSEVIEQLRRCPAGLDPAVAKVVGFGVAYHHAGLTFDERDILEGAFKQGALRVLIATSTLSSGVNLPARRVIVRCPFTFQNQLIDTLSYKQMVGRAGRKGIDVEGESILLCREHERGKVEELVSAALKPVSSCLMAREGGPDEKETLCTAMKRAILEVVASGAASTPGEVEKYASCTMLAASLVNADESSQASTNGAIKQCVQFLEDNEFIRLQKPESQTKQTDDTGTRYAATQLGMACLASSLSPDEGLRTLVELRQARKCFVLENELHLVYLVVPIYAAVSWPNLDWMAFLTLWEALPTDMKRVGELVGVEERFLVRAMRGTIGKTERQVRQLAVHQRFYTALALHDLVNEVPLTTVSRKYGTTKGMLQSLQQAASTFAGMVTAFCSKLGWYNLELLLGQFQDRLQFGVQRELIDLCRLNTLNGQRARMLHKAKIDSVAALANCTADEVETILHNAAPFESKKQGDGESEFEARRRAESRCFWVTGRRGMTIAEAAEEIVLEARETLQRDLMLGPEAAVNWAANTRQITPKNAKGGKGKKSAARGRGTKGRKTGKRKASTSFNKTFKPNISNKVNSFQNASAIKRRSSEKTCEETVSKASRTSLEQKSPAGDVGGAVRISPSKASTPADVANTNKSVAAAECTLDMSAFDLSGQLDEIFETELDDAIISKSAKKRKEKDTKTSPVDGSSPMLKQTKRVSFDVPTVEDDGDDDIFGDSLNGSALDKMMSEQCDTDKGSADTSCPKTPGVRVVHADGQVLDLGVTTSFSDTSGCNGIVTRQSDSHQLKTTPKVSNNRESVDLINDSMGKVADATLSDSFLERAMETHMSADDEDKVPRKKETFLRPSPALRTPRQSPSVDTPRSERSSRRLAAMRRRARGDEAKKASKISPGLLILSDSDSDCLVQSPVTPQAPRLPLKGTQCGVNVPLSSSSSLRVIDVCSDRSAFEAFSKEWKDRDSFAMSLACTKAIPQEEKAAAATQGIGARVTRKRRAKVQTSPSDPDLESLTLDDFGVTVVGLAASWSSQEEEEGHKAYYMSLLSCDINSKENVTPAPRNLISLDEKVNLIEELLSGGSKARRIILFDSKEHFKNIYLALGVPLNHAHDIMDPKVAMWMLHPSDHERNLSNVVMTTTPLLSPLITALKLSSSSGCGSIGLSRAEEGASPKTRACTEAAIVWALWPKLESDLENKGLTKTFRTVEMRSLVSLARMELNGVGFDMDESERQRNLLTDRMHELQKEAHILAGRPFSLSSPDEICQVLYKELGLPVNGEPGRKWCGRARGKKDAPSSNKEALIRLKSHHPLPAVILDWRKLKMAVSNTVYPMQRARKGHPWLGKDRIYTSCFTLTATGRVTLREPNIQSIPRDFEIGGKAVVVKNVSFSSTMEAAAAMKSLSSFFNDEEDSESETTTVVSMRHAVVPSPGFLILAADYSQLELRILAHLSGDKRLKDALNAGQDVFKAIAARWKKLDVNRVSDEERQQAKQICYGMIYGMGTKSLGEQLGIVEEEAAVFLQDFKSAYPDVKSFMERTVVDCKKHGYVETMNGRRRYLPKITGDASHFARAAAERQAINTAVQGSAADLAKAAMVEIDRRIFKAFPGCARPLRPSNRASKGDRVREDGAYFALQMHDELIYEVSANDAFSVAKIVKMVMENACSISVVTPVKVKVGPSWGQLREMEGLL